MLLSQWLAGRVQDVCVQFFLPSEVCGGGLEDYSSQAQGASHHKLQRLVYSIMKCENAWQARVVFVMLSSTVSMKNIQEQDKFSHLIGGGLEIQSESLLKKKRMIWKKCSYKKKILD